MMSRTAVLVVLFLVFFSSALGADENTKWKQWDGGSKTFSLYKGNHDVKTGLPANVDFYAVCSACNSLLNIAFLADPGSAEIMRAWFLTKNAALMNSSAASTVVPGFTWQGNPTEPTVSIFGTQGFATSSEAPPLDLYNLPFMSGFYTQDHRVYLWNVAIGAYAFNSGADTPLTSLPPMIAYSVDPQLIPVADDICGKWDIIANTSTPPDYSVTRDKLKIMDFKFQQNDEGQWNNRYRATGKKDLGDFARWFLSDDGGTKSGRIGQFSQPFPPGADGNYFRMQKAANPALADIIACCEVSDLTQQKITEGNYRNVLRGGWKVAPTFGVTQDIGNGYSGIWMEKSLMSAFPDKKLSQNPGYTPGTEKVVQSALKNLIDTMRDTKHSYVSTFSASDQDCSLKLEIKDVNSSTSMGMMGDTLVAMNPVRCELTVDYQYNTPRDRMTLENASLVVVYRNDNSQQEWREVSLGGIHQPLRNYILDSQSSKEVKSRTFFRVFDDLSKIQCIYGKAQYLRVDKNTMDKVKDLYVTKKRGSRQASYNAFTAPVWFQ
jgi:hypothetical protein